MNGRELQAAIEALAQRLGISPRSISFSFVYSADGGGWEWTASIDVADPTRKARNGALLRRAFYGADTDPLVALAEAEDGFRRWKDQSIAEAERKRAMLDEIASSDPEVAELLRKKGLIES
jgi:hypothetical protein